MRELCGLDVDVDACYGRCAVPLYFILVIGEGMLHAIFYLDLDVNLKRSSRAPRELVIFEAVGWINKLE